MKKTKNSLFTLFTLFFIQSHGAYAYAYAYAYAPSEVEMTLSQVSEHVYYVQGIAGVATDNEGFISNASVILGEQGIIVVDALGTPSLAVLLLQKIKEISDLPVTHVIVTHYHADHIYGLQVFKELGAKIIAPAGFQDYLDAPISAERLEERQFTLGPWVNEETYLVRPDEVIRENTQLDFGKLSLEIHLLGKAHSDGDLSVLVKPDQVLIAGDIIFEGRVPFTGSADTANWLLVLQQLDQTNLAALIPGHGAASNNANETIKLTLRYLQRVRELMKIAVDDFVDFDEAFDDADWSEFAHLPAFEAAHRRNAYGVYLSIEKESLESL